MTAWISRIPWSGRPVLANAAATLMNSREPSALAQQKYASGHRETSSPKPRMWSSCQCVATIRRTDRAGSNPSSSKYWRATGLPRGVRNESKMSQSPPPACTTAHSPYPGPNSETSASSEWGAFRSVKVPLAAQAIRPLLSGLQVALGHAR